MGDISIQEIASNALAFLVALTIHEYAHARSALAAGDDTAKRMGRVTLNPLAHLDPIGTIMFLVMALSGFGIAWGKPVPVNHLNFKSPRWDSLKVSLWGPLSNLILAAVLALILRFALPYIPFNAIELLLMVILINIAIAFFNLIPIAPLDGSHILSSLLPYESARRYDEIMGRYGIMILMAFLLFGATRILVRIPSEYVFKLLMYGI